MALCGVLLCQINNLQLNFLLLSSSFFFSNSYNITVITGLVEVMWDLKKLLCNCCSFLLCNPTSLEGLIWDWSELKRQKSSYINFHGLTTLTRAVALWIYFSLQSKTETASQEKKQFSYILTGTQHYCKEISTEWVVGCPILWNDD